MERQVLMDKLSEFLMVEQGGLELYRVALSRTTDPEIKQHYQEFAQETDRHRAILIRLIERLGGDPSYVSPTARLAQVKAASLLEVALRIDGFSQQEREANDLENVLLAETKDHADWHLLEQLVQQVEDAEVKRVIEEAVREVEGQEDRHLEWARSTLAQVALQMLQQGPAPSPERWQQVISGPVPPIAQVHPAPMPAEAGLLETAQQSPWQATPMVREGQEISTR
jgi:rubrerythrin